MKPSIGGKPGNRCFECSDATKVARNCHLALRDASSIRDIRDLASNPRCASAGYDHNGRLHPRFSLSTKRKVDAILGIESALDRETNENIAADVWFAWQVVKAERDRANQTWADIASKAR